MFIAGFPAGPWGTNCYVVASGPGEACVVVDPGQDAVDPLEALLAEHRLTPVAVLLTHGHFDHTYSVTPVCDGHDVPAFIHPGDRLLLSDPLKGLSPDAAAFFGAPGPRHPYARGLLDALPERSFTPIPGMPPELDALPDGCAFAPRCGRATAACATLPPLAGGVACHHATEHADV